LLSADILFEQILHSNSVAMRSLTILSSTMSPLVLAAVLDSAVTIVVFSMRAFESESKAQCRELKRQKQLRALANRISKYGRTVHQRFPTGDVGVSERDLAEQLRKRTDAVVTALNLLLNEQKVQRAPLNGYWKLNS